MEEFPNALICTLGNCNRTPEFKHFSEIKFTDDPVSTRKYKGCAVTFELKTTIGSSPVIFSEGTSDDMLFICPSGVPSFLTVVPPTFLLP
jgi:hypothetical protein